MKTCLMEVEYNKVQDQLKITRTMLYLVSKGRIREFKGEIIKDERRSQSFENQKLSYMEENKRILNLHEQKFAELVVFQANTTMFQANINTSLKNLETQIRKLALNM